MSSRQIPPVLYVDDEENDGLLLQIAFEQAQVNHPVRLAVDGVQALDYMFGTGIYADREKYPLPGVVLLDFKLPRISGLQVLERLRQDPAFATLPIILFSSSEQPIDQQRARELRADDYIVKPSSMDGFVAVAKMLDERWLQRVRG